MSAENPSEHPAPQGDASSVSPGDPPGASVDPDSVEGLFLTVLQKESPEERDAFLDEICGNDDERRRRVRALLRAYEDAGSFLETPAGGTRLDTRNDEVRLDFLASTEKEGCLGTLGPYEVIDVIGRGGMGIVLRALDPKLNRVVAVKVLAPELAANPNARRRFLREAQAAAAVSHPHVVTIHAVEEGASAPDAASDRDASATLPYLVMECVVGQSLQDKLDQAGSLGVTEILRISHQMALGLAAAHKQGLIHRDIKPANILLENGVERVKITDFGLARLVDDVAITRTGEVSGTPQYMSPEQAKGERVDHRSDLFSLGCVMYAMCTGHSPFRGDSLAHVIQRVTQDEPRPITEFNPDTPIWLCEVIERLLAKAPEKRMASADELAEALAGLLANRQQPVSDWTPGPPRPGALSASPISPTARSTDSVSARGIPLPSWTRWVSVVLVFAGLAVLAGGLSLALLCQSDYGWNLDLADEFLGLGLTGLVPLLCGAALATFNGRLHWFWLAAVLIACLGPIGMGIWLWLRRRSESDGGPPADPARPVWLQRLRTVGTTTTLLGAAAVAWPFFPILFGFVVGNGDPMEFGGTMLGILAIPAGLAVLLGGAASAAAWILSPPMPEAAASLAHRPVRPPATDSVAAGDELRRPKRTLLWMAVAVLAMLLAFPAAFWVAYLVPALSRVETVRVEVDYDPEYPIRKITTDNGRVYEINSRPYLLPLPPGHHRLIVEYDDGGGARRQLTKIVNLSREHAGQQVPIELSDDVRRAEYDRNVVGGDQAFDESGGEEYGGSSAMSPDSVAGPFEQEAAPQMPNDPASPMLSDGFRANDGSPSVVWSTEINHHTGIRSGVHVRMLSEGMVLALRKKSLFEGTVGDEETLISDFGDSYPQLEPGEYEWLLRDLHFGWVTYRRGTVSLLEPSVGTLVVQRDLSEVLRLVPSESPARFRWNGLEYRLDPAQVSAVRLLADTWQTNQPEVRESDIIAILSKEFVGADASDEGYDGGGFFGPQTDLRFPINTIEELYRTQTGHHPAWKELIQPGTAPETYRLAPVQQGTISFTVTDRHRSVSVHSKSGVLEYMSPGERSLTLPVGEYSVEFIPKEPDVAWMRPSSAGYLPYEAKRNVVIAGSETESMVLNLEHNLNDALTPQPWLGNPENNPISPSYVLKWYGFGNLDPGPESIGDSQDDRTDGVYALNHFQAACIGRLLQALSSEAPDVEESELLEIAKRHGFAPRQVPVGEEPPPLMDQVMSGLSDGDWEDLLVPGEAEESWRLKTHDVE